MNKILLAEDEPYLSDIYSTGFKKDGYQVDIAQDGQMALDKIKNDIPDLLVLDIDLLKINGYEVLKILRSEAKTQNLKVIIISNYNQEDFFEKYNINNTDLGVIKYFLKIESTPRSVLFILYFSKKSS